MQRRQILSEHDKRPDEEAMEERLDTVEDLDVPEGEQGDVAGGIKQTVVRDDVGEGQ
jgi:hypothetical protein